MAYTTIDDPEKHFQCVTYTGNGSSRTISYPNADADLDADMIWIKQRDGDATSHTIFDTVRGAQEAIFTNNVNAETTRTDAISAFGTDDFDLGSNGDLNSSSQKYIAWCWKVGTSFSNDASATSVGDIDSSGSVNTDAGISLCSFTGNGSNSQTVKHGLSTAPELIILKARGQGTYGWITYDVINGAGKYLTLNNTDALVSDTGMWSNTAPTSSVFSLSNGGNTAITNPNTVTMMAYCFAGKQGFSKFGSFEGNNDADGSFVYLGFKPAWIIIKDVDSSNTVGGSAATSWGIWDSKRMPANPASNPLFANKDTRETLRGNASSANTGGSDGNGLGGFIHLDMLSNGFKCRSATAELNDTQTYVYMAFAEAPFVNSNGVPCNAR